MPYPQKPKALAAQIQPVFTTAPIAVVDNCNSIDIREYLRLPKNRQVDPIFSLSRSTWNLFILPCKANNFRPPIKSISLRRPGTIRGVRLISVASAREYFERLAVETEAAEANVVEAEG
jgi:hypothetical protein